MTAGRTTTLLLVVASVAFGLVGASPAGASHPASATAGAPVSAAATSDYRQAVDLTFPVAGKVSYSDDYHAPRGGGTRVHKATDVMAPEGAPVHAAVAGTIASITGLGSPLPSYGWMIAIAGDDGRRYSYIHLGRQDGPASGAYVAGLAKGTRVERGQHIGYVGCSGNASCAWPHLHFEISDPAVVDPYGSTRRNPYASLRDAQARGDVPGARRVDQCAPTAAVPAAPVRRVTGDDPVAVSVAAARTGWTESAEAIVATAGDFADALAGTALAARRDAPVLLVDDRLASATAAALADLRVSRVTILGGPDAVSDAVAEQLADVVPTVERLWGADRFATAAAVRTALGRSTEVAVALGRAASAHRSWPDAVAAGALAGGPRDVPVLLVTPSSVPQATDEALAAARAQGATTALLIGGPDAISDNVAAALRATGMTVERRAGATRYQTSLSVVEAALERRDTAPRSLVVASGQSFPDAVVAAPLAARLDAALLLVPSCSLDGVPTLGSHVAGRYRDGVVVGTVDSVSERVREVLSDAMGGAGG